MKFITNRRFSIFHDGVHYFENQNLVILLVNIDQYSYLFNIIIIIITIISIIIIIIIIVIINLIVTYY